MKKSIRLWGAFVLSAAVFTQTPALCAAEVEPGFKSLFNGKDLAGWAGRPEHWSVEDGAITGITTKENPAKGNNFLFAKDGDKDLMADDFEIRFSYKFSSDFGNSGLQYRSKDRGNFVVNGYQGDFEVGTTYSGILYEEGGRGRGLVWIRRFSSQSRVAPAAAPPGAVSAAKSTTDRRAHV